MSTQAIKLKINEESDLFSPYDPDQETISEDISEYLTESLESKGKVKEGELAIHVISDTPVNEENVKQKLREHFIKKRDAVDRALRIYSFKALSLAGFGLVVLAVMFFQLAGADDMLLEILDIVGWVAIWEATSIVIISAQELRTEKKNYKKLIAAEIRVSCQDA